ARVLGWLRDRHGRAASGRHRIRFHGALADGTACGARGRRRHRARRTSLPQRPRMSGVLGALAQIVVPTNLLALAALGLLAGQNAARMPRAILAAFALGLFAGSVLVAMGVRDPPAAIALLA